MHRRIPRASAVLVAALTLSLAAAGARADGWLGATPPPPTTANGASGAVVAVNATGDAAAAWTDDDGRGMQSLRVATRPAGGPWGTPATVATMPAIDAPAVTLNAAGDVAVV
jgi:hypothetical protein